MLIFHVGLAANVSPEQPERTRKKVGNMELTEKLKDKLIELIKDFSNRRVLVMGDLILDRFVWGGVSRISPEAPVPVVVVSREEVRLGGAGNVAANIRALGGSPLLVGVISNDEAGEKIEQEMERLAMKTSGLLLDLGRPTTMKTRIIAGHQQVCRVDQEARAPMSEELFDKAGNCLDINLAETDALLVSDYGKGFINRKLLVDVLPKAKKMGKIVAVDPKFQDYRIYSPCTILTPNKKESEFASRLRIRNEQSLKQAAERILKKTQADNLLITRGEDGMSLFRPTGYSRHIPTSAREVFDVTGAGDTVIACMTLAMSAGANPEEAAILANFAAGIVVGKLGTASVTPAELIQVIRRH
ncbi:MAG: D-glycero-beta-D-manno-heptose-7-phosphate kinase [Acidobacteria bacterium]|nr:D-glycero-beta-D-manno-heptose-7-phosphate kinase [Acidobacteriota bacterium]